MFANLDKNREMLLGTYKKAPDRLPEFKENKKLLSL